MKTAQNVRLVFLTGTPIINYPNEIAVLFNMLRGSIMTFKFKLNVKNKRAKINENYFKKILKETSVSIQKIMGKKQGNGVRKTNKETLSGMESMKRCKFKYLIIFNTVLGPKFYQSQEIHLDLFLIMMLIMHIKVSS